MFKASPPSPTEHVGESATVGAPSSNVSLDFAGSYVLIVEDDPALSLDLVSSLTGAGATPLGPVANLEGAEQIIEAIHCDAIILDLRVGNRHLFRETSALQADPFPHLHWLPRQRLSQSRLARVRHPVETGGDGECIGHPCWPYRVELQRAMWGGWATTASLAACTKPSFHPQSCRLEHAGNAKEQSSGIRPLYAQSSPAACAWHPSHCYFIDREPSDWQSTP